MEQWSKTLASSSTFFERERSNRLSFFRRLGRMVGSCIWSRNIKNSCWNMVWCHAVCNYVGLICLYPHDIILRKEHNMADLRALVEDAAIKAQYDENAKKY